MTFRFNGLQAGAYALACISLVPVLVVLASLVSPVTDTTEGIWAHLAATVLGDLAVNTAVLLAGVGLGTFVLGTGLGWLTGCCDFPGRKFFSVALLLPMAMPTYVFAFVCLGLLDFSGPVQTYLRVEHGMTPVDVRTPLGVCAVLMLALYPYVYLLARSGFRTQGQRALETARTLGLTPWRAFYRVALPLCRPWIAAGLMLVFMETLADFGAVSIFNYDTFTTAIYKAWYGLFSVQAAAQLSSILVVLALAVLAGEQLMRSKLRYAGKGGQAQPLKLSKAPAAWAVVVCAVVFALGFVLPCVQLLVWSWEVCAEEFGPRYLELTYSTLLLGVGAAVLTLAAALLLAYAKRRDASPRMAWLTRTATLGYALPGTVLAVGVVLPTSWFDNAAAYVLGGLGWEVGTLLQGTVAVMLLAYMVRFMAVGFGAVDSAMQRITPSMDEASQLMDVTGLRMLKRVHLPLLRSGMFTGMVLVLVDVMKEMPLTLMTRPFGWDTLAVKIYELTSEGEWERAALPALLLVVAGVLPVLLLTRQADRGPKETA